MSYVRQDTKQAGADTPLTNSPRHMVKARVAVPVGPRALASAEWQLTRTLALTGSVGNLFDQRYAEPGSDEHLPDSIQQVGRTMRVGVRWTIRAR